jgi:hypothetical protein
MEHPWVSPGREMGGLFSISNGGDRTLQSLEHLPNDIKQFFVNITLLESGKVNIRSWIQLSPLKNAASFFFLN